MRLGLGLKVSSPLFLFSLLLAPLFPAPCSLFFPFSFFFRFSSRFFPFLCCQLFSLILSLSFPFLFPSQPFSFFFSCFSVRLFPAPLFSFLPSQLRFSLFLSLLFSRFLPVPPISHCRTWKLHLYSSALSLINF